MYENSRQKGFICGALIGGTVALLTSLLFTTKKGRQIQRQIADAYEGLEQTVSDQFSDAKDKVEEGVDQLHKKVTAKTKDENHKDSK